MKRNRSLAPIWGEPDYLDLFEGFLVATVECFQRGALISRRSLRVATLRLMERCQKTLTQGEDGSRWFRTPKRRERPS